ncbi:MAG: lipid-binding SYLF domain-containing protein [Pseudomonadota bacterium]
MTRGWRPRTHWLGRFAAAASGVALLMGAATAPEPKPSAPLSPREDLTEPVEDVDEAMAVVRQLKREPGMGDALSRARGVFIVPDYATASLMMGGAGGEGVMLKRLPDGGWSLPLFFDIAALDTAVDDSAAAGALVMVLLTDAAVARFEQQRRFSLEPGGGMRIAAFAGGTRAADVLVWSDGDGLLADGPPGVRGVAYDAEETRRYYERPVTPRMVLAGDVEDPRSEPLRSEFAAFTRQRVEDP